MAEAYYSLAGRKASWGSVFRSAFLLEPICIDTLQI